MSTRGDKRGGNNSSSSSTRGATATTGRSADTATVATTMPTGTSSTSASSSSTGTTADNVVVPGKVVGSGDEYTAGEGTYIRRGVIYASVVGITRLKRAAVGDAKPVLFVESRRADAAVVPIIGSIVTARITKIQPLRAVASILCVADKPLRENYAGIIRMQDVRATEIDKVEIAKVFKPGDIVLTEVISLGDARSYYLSTAKKGLGVVSPQSS
ncbi:exosome complex component CSL4 [Pelomyxa schiedti]|nr:exosome complex component CSL4 [Pelomyxa schiedti]